MRPLCCQSEGKDALMLFFIICKGWIVSMNIDTNAQSVNRFVSDMPLSLEAIGSRMQCFNSGSSFITGGAGEGGDKGAGAGDNDGSLESERGGVNSPQINVSRIL